MSKYLTNSPEFLRHFDPEQSEGEESHSLVILNPPKAGEESPSNEILRR